MENKIKLITEALQEIKSAAIGVKTDSEYNELINKYDMLFMGSKFNAITSLELAHYLKKNIDSSISHEDLLETLPAIKDNLSLELEGQVLLEDADKPTREIKNYLIYLF